MRRHIVASPSDAGSAGRLGWGSREIARRAGVESRGRPTPAGRAEQLVSAAAILVVPTAGVFSKRHSLSNSHADGLKGSQKTCLFSKEMRSSTLHKGSDIAITQ